MENIRPLTAEERAKALKEIKENTELFSVRKTKHGIETGITHCKKEDIKQGLTTLVDNLLSMEKITINDLEEIIAKDKSAAIIATVDQEQNVSVHILSADRPHLMALLTMVVKEVADALSESKADVIKNLMIVDKLLFELEKSRTRNKEQ